MVQGNLKSQKGSFWTNTCKGYPEQRFVVHYNRQNGETLKAMSRDKLTKSDGTKIIFSLV